MSAQRLSERFQAAFNEQDLRGLVSLLSSDATAEVLDSGFPVERGPEVIAKTSFPHILGIEDGSRRVQARAWVDDEDSTAYVLLLLDGRLDSAVRVLCTGELIDRLEYVVQPHQPAEVKRLAERAGIATL